MQRAEGQRLSEDDLVKCSPDERGEPGTLARRVLRPQTLISFAISAALIVIVVRRFEIDLDAVWQQVRDANPWLYGAAIGIWYGGFIVRSVRWRQMLALTGVDRAHGYAVPSTGGLVTILLLAWFANCVAPAKLGDVYRSYLLKQDAGSSFSTGLGTILAERLLDLVMLVVLMSGAAFLVFHDRIPAETWQAFTLGLALLGAAAIGLSAMWLLRGTLERRLPERMRHQYGRLHEATFRCLRQPALVLALGALLWLIEGARIWLIATSLHIEFSPVTALFIALMAALLSTVPITPAGLGVVEVGIGAVLVQIIGLSQTAATSIILLDRLGTYWLVIVLGIVLYLRRTRGEIQRLASPPTKGRLVALDGIAMTPERTLMTHPCQANGDPSIGVGSTEAPPCQPAVDSFWI